MLRCHRYASEVPVAVTSKRAFLTLDDGRVRRLTVITGATSSGLTVSLAIDDVSGAALDQPTITRYWPPPSASTVLNVYSAPFAPGMSSHSSDVEPAG